ncbi:MAG: cytochrome c3 family protein [Bryobacteraceae bacterium]
MLVPAAFGQDKPFSHKFHLAMKLECVGCHVAAPESKAATDNLLPAQTACARCHDRAMPVGEPRARIVTRFNHQRHVGLGNVGPVIAAALRAKTYHHSSTGVPPDPALEAALASASACAACHRGIEQSEHVDGTNFPAMPDCLVCHPKIDAPFSCEKCHDAGSHLKPASHAVGDFMDQHSTGRAGLNKLSCVVCHGKGFRCMGCHG